MSDSVRDLKGWLLDLAVKAEGDYMKASADMRDGAGTISFLPAMHKFEEALALHRNVRNAVLLIGQWNEEKRGGGA